MAIEKGNLIQVIGTIRSVVHAKRYKHIAIVSSIIYGIIYSFAVGIVAHYPGIRISDYARVPYYSLSFESLTLYEPRFVAYPNDYIVIFAPWSSVLVAILFSVLVGLNISMIAYSTSCDNCNVRGARIGALGAVPSLFSVVCCGGPLTLSLLAAFGSGLVSILGRLSGLLTALSFAVLLANLWFIASKVGGTLDLKTS